VGDQFDVIEAGGHGRRRWIGFGVVLALLVIPIVGLLASRDPTAEPNPVPVSTPDPIQSLTRVVSPPNQVFPSAKPAEGGDLSIPVVFPDGRRAVVRYPAAIRLAQLGARPFQGLWIDGVYRAVSAPYGGEVEVTRGGEPIRHFSPDVTLWPRQPGGGQYGQVLLFAFGEWRLALYDRLEGLAFEQRLAVARNLHGKVVKGGYLVLSAGGPVRLAKPGETDRATPIGPQLWFGGGMSGLVALVPMPQCARFAGLPSAAGGHDRSTRSVCRGDVQVSATGAGWFVREAIDGIRITLK
jgi:hypothetical protein